MNLRSEPTVFVVWKWIKKIKNSSVSTGGFKIEWTAAQRRALTSPEMSYDFKVRLAVCRLANKGDLNIGCFFRRNTSGEKNAHTYTHTHTHTHTHST